MVRRLEALFAAVAILAGLVSIGLAYSDAKRDAYVPPPPKTDVVVSAVPTPTAVPSASPTPTPQPTPLPASLRIDHVPFTVQAPTGNWDAAHEEYCEAAAALMVGRYYKGLQYPNDRIPPADADSAMGQIVQWERQQWPGVLDLSLDKVAQVGQHFYDLQPTLQPATLDNVKAALAAGHPVMIPVATHGAPGGRAISPYYSAGNVYHVIVLVGYDGNFVFANDAGISQGQNYKYDWPNVLEPAMDGQAALRNPQTQGRVMLTFTPQAAAAPSPSPSPSGA